MAERIGRIPSRSRVRELERIYRIVEREIVKEMFLVDIGNYRELKAIKTRENIDGLIKMLNKAAIKWSKEAVPEAYEKGYAVSKTRLEILGAQKDGEFNNKIHVQAIEHQIDETMDVLIKANQSINLNVAMYLYLTQQAFRGIMQIQAFDFRDEELIADLLDDAIRAGETRTYAKNLVMDYIKSEVGEGKFIQIRGRNYNMEKYADGVAKTRLRVVQTESVLNSCKEYDNDLVQVSDHGTTTPICLPYEGNVYSLSGKSSAYPYLDAYPPFHFRCQHHISPTSEVALGVRERYA